MPRRLFRITFILVCLLVSCPVGLQAQTSDSLIVDILRGKGVRFSGDNSVVLLKSGREKFDDMFSAIRQAKQSVHLEYFNFRHDSIADALFRLLEAKAAEGVEVRALYDDFGNWSNNRPIRQRELDSLRAHGIEIFPFDPIKFPWVNHVFSRNHRKIVVIDGEIAYTGGMNVANYYIKGTKEVGEWRDMHCRIEGGAVNTLQHIFLRMWNKTSGQDVRGPQYYHGSPHPLGFEGLKPDTCRTAGSKMVGIINREPERTPRIIRDFYYDAINSAKDSIQIINPYLTLNHRLKKALRKAIRRGVKVSIMVSTHSDIPLTPDCVFYNVHKLMRHGAEVWMYQPGFHHSKVMMVDGRFCTVGSANLNSRSLRFDYEANAVVIDPCTTGELQRMFIDDTKRSFRLTQETWNKFRTPWQKFVGWFAHLLAPVL